MKKIFVDSGFFVAISDKSDHHFEIASQYLSSPAIEGIKLITNNLVMAETITRARYRAGFKCAKEFGEGYRRSNLIEIIWIDRLLEEEAWKIFLKYSDKDLSFVDCLSFACMKTYKINEALTFDKHFRQLGFSCLPG